jgi:GNAT superfamily N-acetyltransferase
MEKQFWSAGDHVLALSGSNDQQLRSEIHDQIKAFNDAMSEPHRLARSEGGVRPLHILLRDGNGNLTGGLIADTYWQWLDLDDFWLVESVRGQGIGRSMLQAAEQEAVARGCRFAKLETFSFQARGFYEKCGYRVVGQLQNYPPGQSFFWMQKDLISEG